MGGEVKRWRREVRRFGEWGEGRLLGGVGGLGANVLE